MGLTVPSPCNEVPPPPIPLLPVPAAAKAREVLPPGGGYHATLPWSMMPQACKWSRHALSSQGSGSGTPWHRREASQLASTPPSGVHHQMLLWAAGLCVVGAGVAQMADRGEGRGEGDGGGGGG